MKLDRFRVDIFITLLVYSFYLFIVLGVDQQRFKAEFKKGENIKRRTAFGVFRPI